MTAKVLITLDVQTRVSWRRWLAKNHASSPGVWLHRHKQHTGIASMPLEDLVCEALCFGWVDSLIKRVDDNCYAIKVTPRRSCRRTSPRRSTRTPERGVTFRRLLHGSGVTSSCGYTSPKRPETRERRIRESIELLAAGKQLGLK